jgi:hypothetical protein
MIRPITCVTLLLACGSGLYLYQTKHRVHVLDGQIEQVVHQTAQVREQIRMLRAEWTLLDQPDRLQQLAAQFLDLQPTKPAQFASTADLDSRLPPVPEPQPSDQPGETPVADAPGPSESAAAPSPPPQRRKPAGVAVAAPAVHVAEHPSVGTAEGTRPSAATPTPGRPQFAAAQPARAAQPEPSTSGPPHLVKAALPRPMPAELNPAPRSVAAAPRAGIAPPSAYGGSMLGMAQRAAVPPPAPAPVWFNWDR